MTKRHENESYSFATTKHNFKNKKQRDNLVISTMKTIYVIKEQRPNAMPQIGHRDFFHNCLWFNFYHLKINKKGGDSNAFPTQIVCERIRFQSEQMTKCTVKKIWLLCARRTNLNSLIHWTLINYIWTFHVWESIFPRISHLKQ